jgi:tRNA G18 (ribose-2'-O)-methylase SpoU
MLAAADRRPLPSVEQVLTGAHAVAVLEGINDHENMGAIFRSARAFDVGAVVLDPRCCDPLYRRSVRVSMGSVFTIPYARAETWPDVLDDLRTAGFTVAALTPAPDAVALEAASYGGDARLAVLLGSEGPGLTAGAMSRSDVRLRIPMAGGVDSLNVAAAAAVTFWQLGRRGDADRLDELPPQPGESGVTDMPGATGR